MFQMIHHDSPYKEFSYSNALVSNMFFLSTAREGLGKMFQMIHHESPYEQFNYSDALVFHKYVDSCHYAGHK